MRRHQEDALSAVSNRVFVAHKPNYTLPMQRGQTLKYARMLTGIQQRDLRCFAGACCGAFYQALALQKACDAQGEKELGDAGLCKLLTA